MRAPGGRKSPRQDWAFRHTREALLALLAVAGLPACIAIPIPVDHTRGRAVDPQKTPIEIGVTTRDEIIARAGEPDALWEEKRIIAYSWEHANWAVVGAVSGGLGPALFFQGDFVHHRMLLIQFDNSDHVVRAEWVERPGEKSYGVFLREWASGKTNANP
jgi:hypothetical protein